MSFASRVVGCRLIARRWPGVIDIRSAATAPSSAFGTFSPAEKRGGEGLSRSRLREDNRNKKLLTTRPRRNQPTTDNARSAA
jgi:hypothetical protein